MTDEATDKTLHIIYLRPIGWADWQIPIGAIDSDGTGYVAATLPDAKDLATPGGNNPEDNGARRAALARQVARELRSDLSLHHFAGAAGYISVSRPYSCHYDIQWTLDRVLPGGVEGADDADE